LPRAGDFQYEGPALPVEFSRVSLDGRVTLVLDPLVPPVQTYWVELACSELETAIGALGERERIPPEMRARHVGALARAESPQQARGDTDGRIVTEIASWLASQPLDAVLWTALPSRGPAGEGGRPGFETLLAHLESLEGPARDRAEQYIRRTPRPIRTPRRERFESLLGWYPVDSDGPGSPG
jgi:hypothetical protein